MSSLEVLIAYSGGGDVGIGQIALIGGAVIAGLVLLGAVVSWAGRRR
jgi:hypothetical protein